MDGRKLHHFVCFAVTMGLVACASGDTAVTEPEPAPKPAPAAEPDKVPDVISNVNIPQSETTMEPTPPVKSTVNSTTTELDPTSSVKSSRPAPCKSCPTELAVEKCQAALFQIMSRALLFTCIVLLITVTALACKVSHLRGRLINGAGVGVAETSVMLEEVTPVRNEEETAAEPR